jgi:hypothetical protein
MMDQDSGARGGKLGQVDAGEHIALFTWRDLTFHVVTKEPLTTEQTQILGRSVRKIERVGLFAELVAMVTGRHVRIRTERPSTDVRFEVGT